MTASQDMGRPGRRSWLAAMRRSTAGNRRARVLAHNLAEAMPHRGTVLDFGYGDGAVAAALTATRRDLQVSSDDAATRGWGHIAATEYDGEALPFARGSFDYVTLVDVLHHARNPLALLAEATRLASRGVVVKDHLREGLLARPTLRLMEWIGDGGRHRLSAPNYFDRAEWDGFFRRAGCDILSWQERLGLYPAPASWLFDRHLHFIAVIMQGSR